jgi:hypothetical protein
MASANLLKADVYSEYFPNPLLSFIGTNQIGDCAAYPRPAQNRVHKIKLATAFVFGVDVGARRFRLGTLQILPNHGKSILATDGMKLKSRIPARPHGRALRGGCGATSLAVPATIPFALFAQPILVEASCAQLTAHIASDWPLAGFPVSATISFALLP